MLQQRIRAGGWAGLTEFYREQIKSARFVAGTGCNAATGLYALLPLMGGVIDLLHHGAYFVAIVVFVASVCIPLGKFIAIAWIAIALRRPPGAISAHKLHRLHEIVEFIGRWSMVDVFVVAILSALVQMSVVLSINPGLAAISFALSVAFTMLSAQSLDPRLIYDASEPSPHE